MEGRYPKTKLERMITSKDGVELCYDGKEYLITLEDKKAKIYDKKGRETDIKKVDHSAKMAIAEYDEEKYIDVYLCNQTFTFGKNSKGYYYRTENGKETQLTDISKVDAGGKEYLGSGRIYIWSRTLPILKNISLQEADRIHLQKYFHRTTMLERQFMLTIRHG